MLGLGLHLTAAYYTARDNALTRAMSAIAGPTNSVVIDRQRVYWLAGKVRDGS